MRIACSQGVTEVLPGMKWRDGLHGGLWEVVEPSGGTIYSPSGLGGTPTFWCRAVDGNTHWKEYAREDGCIEFCGDSIAASLMSIEETNHE